MVLEDDVYRPEERMDLDDGDPYREYGSLAPTKESDAEDPLEVCRVIDIKNCVSHIRGDWCRHLSCQQKNKDVCISV